MCRQKVGISENRWNHIRYILVCAKIPELLQDFDVADRLRSHPAGCDQLCEGFAGVNGELRGFQIPRQFRGGRLTSPIRVLRREVGSSKPFGIGAESTRIELGTESRGIVRDPFFEHSFRVDEFTIAPGLEPEESTGFEVLQDGPHSAERNTGLCCDLAIAGANRFRMAQQREDDPDPGGIQSAVLVYGAVREAGLGPPRRSAIPSLPDRRFPQCR